MRDKAAVDVESLSGDVARARRGQEHDHRRDVLRLVGAAQRNALDAAPFDLLDARALLLGDHAHHLGINRGAHDAGTDGVDVDVVRSQLLRRRLGQADHRPLARGVDRVRRAGKSLSGDRGDVDDAPAAARDHLARDALQAEDHALSVDAENAIPIVLGEIHDVGAARDARVVHPSAWSASARGPFDAIAAAVCSSLAPLMSLATTSAPAAAKAKAAALPMPWPAPVTIAT